MFKRMSSHLGIKLAVLGLWLGMIALWVAADWPCVIRAITGIPCAGCGMSRAWLCALRLELGDAFRYHPMFWSVPVLILFGFCDGKLLRSQKWNLALLILLLFGLAVCYVLRLVAYLRGEIVF